MRRSSHTPILVLLPRLSVCVCVCVCLGTGGGGVRLTEYHPFPSPQKRPAHLHSPLPDFCKPFYQLEVRVSGLQIFLLSALEVLDISVTYINMDSVVLMLL